MGWYVYILTSTVCSQSEPMDALVRKRLIDKSEELTQDINVRTRNVIFRLLKDVEGQLVPLIVGSRDAISIPSCGKQTASYINTFLDQLRPYYQKLMNMTPEEIEQEENWERQQEKIADTQKRNYAIKFKEVDDETDRCLQEIYVRMRARIPHVRSRNLVAYHIRNYKDIEPYLNDPSLVNNWHNAGISSSTIILQFFNAFHEEYLAIIKEGKGRMVSKLIDFHYPFLNEEQRDFVLSFLKAEGRVPALFIALCHLRQTNNRTAQVFARVNGIVGEHTSIHQLADELDLSRERIRQLVQKKLSEDCDYPYVWKEEAWKEYPFFNQLLLTEKNTGWEKLKTREHLDNLDFYGALAILAQMRNITIVALLGDGTKSNGRRAVAKGWQQPRVLFAYDSRYNIFRFADALGRVGHEAHLQRINDKRLSLKALMDDFLCQQPNHTVYQKIRHMLCEVLPMFSDVEIQGDDIVLHTNRINYTNEIYDILNHHGNAMTVDNIFAEFKQRHPEDHHTDSSFIRSYMLSDKRFEAVGSKSTYQLSEWKRFAGTLGALAEHILMAYDNPVKVDELCEMMREQRGNTTRNSCSTSIYHAVNAGRLLYYTEENNKGVYVGLVGRNYEQRFWLSPVNVQGALHSLRRFLVQYGRWPFSSRKDGIEASLYYTWRKYNRMLHVTAEEHQQFMAGMADIEDDHYPSNERELAFAKQCDTLTSFFADNHRLPTSREHSKLLAWYWDSFSNQKALKGYRKYRFEKMLADINGMRTPTAETPLPSNREPDDQLLLDFREKDGDQLLLDFD